MARSENFGKTTTIDVESHIVTKSCFIFHMKKKIMFYKQFSLKKNNIFSGKNWDFITTKWKA